jgi:hypothetical protein
VRKKFKKRIQETGIETDSLTDGLPKITKIIEESFGTNYDVSIEPFGIKYSEAIVEAEVGIMNTGTATIGGTWGSVKNIRLDVDEKDFIS